MLLFCIKFCCEWDLSDELFPLTTHHTDFESCECTTCHFCVQTNNRKIAEQLLCGWIHYQQDKEPQTSIRCWQQQRKGWEILQLSINVTSIIVSNKLSENTAELFLPLFSSCYLALDLEAPNQSLLHKFKTWQLYLIHYTRQERKYTTATKHFVHFVGVSALRWAWFSEYDALCSVSAVMAWLQEVVLQSLETAGHICSLTSFVQWLGRQRGKRTAFLQMRIKDMIKSHMTQTWRLDHRLLLLISHAGRRRQGVSWTEAMRQDACLNQFHSLPPLIKLSAKKAPLAALPGHQPDHLIMFAAFWAQRCSYVTA